MRKLLHDLNFSRPGGGTQGIAPDTPALFVSQSRTISYAFCSLSTAKLGLRTALLDEHPRANSSSRNPIACIGSGNAAEREANFFGTELNYFLVIVRNGRGGNS
jgi:hypothetical protein